METRANNALIGLFTLAVIVAALGFVAWFARTAEGAKVERYRVVFTNAITGLSVGSPVLLNGIRVGQIDTLNLAPEDPSRVVAEITVGQGTPVKTDTHARLEFQGLTGGAYIQLYGGTSGSQPLKPPEGQQVATLMAERSELQNLFDGARDAVAKATVTLQNANDWYARNQSALTGTVQNVQTFTRALSDNSDKLSNLITSVDSAATNIAAVSGRLNGITDRTQALLNSVDPADVRRTVGNVVAASDQLRQTVAAVDTARINSVVANAQALTQTLADQRQSIAEITTNTAELTRRLNGLAPKVETGIDTLTSTANRAQALIAAVDPADVRRTVRNVATASDQLRQTIASVDTARVNTILGNAAAVSQTLADARPAITTFATNAAGVSQQVAALLPRVSTGVDRVTALATSTQKLVGSIDSAQVNRVVTNLAGSSDRLRTILAAIDDTKIRSTIDSIQSVAGTLAEARPAITTVANNASSISRQVSELLPRVGTGVDRFNTAAGSVQALITSVDPARVNRIVSNISGASDQLRTILAALDDTKLRATLDNVQNITATLSAARPQITAVLDNAVSVSNSVKSLVPGLQASLDDVRRITGSVDSAKIGRVVDNVDRLTSTLGNDSPVIDAILKDVRKVSGDFAGLTPQIDAALTNITRVAQAIDNAKVQRVVDNVDRFASTLGGSTAQVQEVIANAQDIGRKLDAAAGQIGGVVDNLKAATSPDASKGMFAAITAAAVSLRRTADNFDARTANLTKNLTGFSGSGLRDVQQLTIQGQQTIKELQRTVNSINRNPQQFIFGGRSSLPTYNGQ